jgi:glycosyltransferase involved in cell wall biosynthesis
MKIWFAASIPENSSGGVNRSMTGLFSILKSMGHKTKIIYSKKIESYLKFSFMLGIRLLLSPGNRPDWIIARSTDGLICSLICKIFRLKTRVALHSHGWEEKVYKVEKRLPYSILNNPTTFRARLLRFPLLNLQLKLSTICICGTFEEARWLKDRNPDLRKKIKVIGNGIKPTESAFWPEQENQPPSFMITGAFTWKKNIEYGIECFRKVYNEISDSRLFLIGTGTLSPKQLELIAEFGDSVFIVERESPQLMNRWYETCPFLFSTSRYEGGHAFTILEAQNRGVTVFASSIPSTKEIITDYHNGILLTGFDLLTDADKILSVIQNDKLCKRIGMNAWRRAQRQRWERQGLRMEKLFMC